MDKSTRKRKICRKSPVGAGDKAKTHCPPNMDASLKRSLKKEIRDFDASEAHKEAELSASGGPGAEAYSSWLYQHGGREPVEANPDSLSDEDGINYILSTKDPKIEGFLKEVRQIFSPKELKVWNMMMKHCMTYQEVADLMNTSPGDIWHLLRRAKSKFIKYMEACKDA